MQMRLAKGELDRLDRQVRARRIIDAMAIDAHALEQRQREQDETLAQAARFVKPGGRLAYVTCSLLKAENEDRVNAFLAAHADFLPLDMAHAARKAGAPDLAAFASPLGPGLRLTPASAGTDGFYVALLTRA